MFVDDPSDYIGQVAIIGMAGRFPKAKNLEEFWQNLRSGTESISFFTNQEVESTDIDKIWLTHPNFVKAKAILEGVDLFDASFFGYSPREAEIIDPQSRVFLESAWEALEDAGYDSEFYEGRIGVYAGAGVNTYLLFNLFTNPKLIESSGVQQVHVSNHLDTLTTRTAYKLNLQSAGITVQTACSTSLVAVHLACQSLLSGECDIVLAGGVSVSVPQKSGYLYQEGGIFSPDGHCRAFDAKAQGTVTGNGVGVVVLKRLADALTDGDYIHAVIKGSATNNDGSLKVGYTAPSVEGQSQVIAEAQAIAGIEPEMISYVETHGTGTALGDPIEVAALTQAFHARTEKRGFCAIGSVKTNIGHLGAAAGIAGLSKTVLALKHQQIPPSLHFEQPNPRIDFINSPFYVNSTLSEWKTNGIPRYAGVSSFGIGGTNAHVVLEEAPAIGTSGPSRSWQLLLLSAKTNSALEKATANLVAYLRRYPNLNLADVACTLQKGRRAFDHRRMIVSKDLEEAINSLDALAPQRVLTHYQEPCDRSVVFMFPGQGAQYVNMGRDLYQTEPEFRQWVDRCSELLQPYLGLDIRHILYPDDKALAAAAEQLKQTSLTQPALFMVEYALAQLWMAWGIHPVAMIGHSIGEYVAACLAGVFSLEEALALVAWRGRLMQQQPSGAMLSISLPKEEIEPLLGQELALAGSNAPSLCTVSGSTGAVNALQARLTKQGVNCRRLNTSHAFHSPMMTPIIESFIEKLGKVDLKSPKIPFVSNVTGSWITAEEATTPDYWAQHLRQTVRFSEGIVELLGEPERVFLEVGPGRTLSTFTRQHQGLEQAILTSVRHPQETCSDVAFLLNALGRLWLTGVQVDWSGYYAHEQRHRIPLPTYPFERQRYWVEPSSRADNTYLHQTKADKKSNIAEWFYIPSWKRSSLPTQSRKNIFANSQKPCWLIFIDTLDIGTQIAKRLELEGHTVVTVSVAEQFTQLNDFGYAINPQQRDDYRTLLEKLSIRNLTPNSITHLWGLTSSQSVQPLPQFFEACQNLGFYSLLFLVQTLGKLGISNTLQLTVITNNVHDVNGDERVFPEKATVLGACKVIPQEYLNIACRAIDLVIPEPRNYHNHQLLDQLLAELWFESSESVVAYRGKHRWVQTFEPILLEASGTTSFPYRQKGVYLITGGFGGIGLALAEFLAQTVQAKLVLIGRSGLPPKDEWSQWLATHDLENDIRRKIEKVQGLENLGAEVLIGCADVADQDQMQAVVTQALKVFGQIHGVIHAAGIGGGGLMQLQTPEKLKNVLAAKVKGTQVLDALFKDSQLDFLVLFSSRRAILGGPGRVDYCAANAFLDAIARRHSSRPGTPTISINWGTWQEAGMSVEAAQQVHPEFEKVLANGMSAQEGWEALTRVLQSGLSQLVVSPEDFQALIEQSNMVSVTSGVLGNLPFPPQPGVKHPRPQLGTAYIAPRNPVEQSLAQVWQRLLGLEQVGVHDNFFELGGDSVVSIQVVAQAHQAGIKLTPQQIFEYQTIAELAAVALASKAVWAEQGLVTGSVPLTPVQQWFFEQNQPEPHHWNQTIFLEVLQPLNSAFLEQAFHGLLQHHDALRLRFTPSESDWNQVNAGSEESVPFVKLDLSALSAEEQGLALEATATELQASLDLSKGPIMRIALFNLGATRTDRLLIIIHHLAVDVVSWRILLEDLQTAYQQLLAGKAIQLSPKTTSFKQWAERLGQYACSEEPKYELDKWLAVSRTQVARIPMDHPEGANTISSADIVSMTLSPDETEALLHEVPAIHHTRTEEILLTALVQAFAQLTGIPSLLVDLEGSGREAIFDDVDLSRTIGWFTTIAPVLLGLEETRNPVEALKGIKEQLSNLSNQGIGYGALRYLSGDVATAQKLQALPQAEVIFLYLGQFSKSLPETSPFRLTQEFNGPERSPRGLRPHLFQVTGFVTEGQLQLNWTYSRNVHRPHTVEELAQKFVQALRSLITDCQSAKAEDEESSVFLGVELSEEKFAKVLEEMHLN